MSLSRAASSVSGSTCGSRPSSSAASVSSSIRSSQLEAKDPKEALKDAQQRAKASLKALQSELKGSAAATPARYSTWPIGCAVKVAFEDSLFATLVGYDKAANTFVVKLEDGSTREVPAKRVTRVRARDRMNAQSENTAQAARPQISGAVRTSSVEKPPSRRAQPLPLEWPQMPGQSFEPQPQMLGAVTES